MDIMLRRDTRGPEEERGGGASEATELEEEDDVFRSASSLWLVIRAQQVEPLQFITTRWTAGVQ